MNIDDFFTKTGTYGWFQKRTYIFIFLVTLGGCMQAFLQVFVAGQGDHWCRVSQWENDTCDFTNVSQSECRELKRRLSTPLTNDDVLQSCQKYNLTGVDLETAIEDNITQYDVIGCDEGWYFDKSVFRSTMTEDWNLVCDNFGIPNLLQSIYMVGYLAGSVVYGSLADRFGRYYILLFCSFSAGGLGVLSALSPNVYIYGALRLLVGASVYGVDTCWFCAWYRNCISESTCPIWGGVVVRRSVSVLCASRISSHHTIVAMVDNGFIFGILCHNPGSLVSRPNQVKTYFIRLS
ncbi:putative organic cation transporter protein-like [Apostichopus japonicus]|uniref:Putative organic cation transporter protein-like n=1 Tax=Stichopus japonicus TaxID=307972 RepID=A0A2G8KAX8_STIJA|nr:putative organic cation transporter protein-like [Apostichopus japonicus]